MDRETYAILYGLFVVVAISGIFTFIVIVLINKFTDRSKPTQQWILEDELSDTKVEDSGVARYTEIDDPETDMFIRIHSYDITHRHTNFKQMEGRRVRITVEVVE